MGMEKRRWAESDKGQGTEGQGWGLIALGRWWGRYHRCPWVWLSDWVDSKESREGAGEIRKRQ